MLGDRESHISDIHFHGESKLRALAQFEKCAKNEEDNWWRLRLARKMKVPPRWGIEVI